MKPLFGEALANAFNQDSAHHHQGVDELYTLYLRKRQDSGMKIFSSFLPGRLAAAAG